MPIQLALGNPAPDATLVLREVQPMRGGDFAAFLVVRSGAFAAAVPFFFSRDAMLDFIASLAEVVGSGTSAATLTSTMRGSFISLEGEAANILTVRGTLREAEGSQVLEFRFTIPRADATPLLDGARRLVEPASGSPSSA